ncbi:hypothetical protein [Kurthia senegalensis]|uniref:hypothetical protein n=1 Tax=Kurthia senegalensis TaxID=1033740 RepID=UPI000315F22B|nr:hypothetical protein [Kurthia senegalensis]
MIIATETKEVELNKNEVDLLLVAMETAKEEFSKLEGFETYSISCENLLEKLYAAK